MGIISDYPMKEDCFDGYRFPEVDKAFAGKVCNRLEAGKKEQFCRAVVRN